MKRSKTVATLIIRVNDGVNSIEVPVPQLKRGNCAVYEIKNILNGDIYIGQTNCLKKRWSRHKRDLERGIHSNRRLQAAFNEVGLHGLQFSVIIFCKESQLLTYEHTLINVLHPEYNYKLPCQN